MALGLAHGKVVLVEGNPEWDRLYRAEEQQLRSVIGDMALDIQHIGSTAIAGIKAKPIIDILVGLARFEDGVLLVGPLQRLGYDYVGTQMVPNDHLFGKGTARTHLLHAVVHGGYHWRRNLQFRDRLRVEPELALAYEQLKIELAARFPDDRAGYTAAKAAFIDPVADV
ncbi:MAG: GrpB family protein [Devosia sp.]|nr:GrpB family protein [Devosia sp.]